MFNQFLLSPIIPDGKENLAWANLHGAALGLAIAEAAQKSDGEPSPTCPALQPHAVASSGDVVPQRSQRPPAGSVWAESSAPQRSAFRVAALEKVRADASAAGAP